MALEGNLTSFKIEEILQLIAVQQKTGMLSVAANERTAVLFFSNGKIVSTRDRRSKTRDPFREYLTRYGCLSREEHVRLTQITSASKLDLLDVLVPEGFFDEKALARHWRNHIQEALHDVLTWDQCSYKFVSGEEMVAGVRTLGDFLVEPFLMESMRRIDEFPMLLEAFPAKGIRIAALGQPADDTAEMMESEKTVLAIVKTARPVREILSRAQLPAFDVYEALRLLKEKNLIVVEADTSADEETVGATGARARSHRRGNPLVLLASMFLVTACTLFGVSRQSDRGVAIARTGVLADDPAARTRVEHRVRWLLESYRAEEGVYPVTLETLRSAGLADRATLDRAAAYDLRYKLTRDGDAYTLL